MAIVQDAFYIPDDIATGLATGLYRRIGSVVRYAVGPNKGQIVKHLKPIDLNAVDDVKGVGVEAFKFVKQHKKESFFVLAGAAAVGVGTWAYFKIKNREPQAVTDYRTALGIYINAVREGKVTIEIINDLMAALEELKKHKDYEKISIQLTSEDLEVLVGRIYNYTIKLAQDNNVAITEEELKAADLGNTNNIINLQNCLKAQKKIFESAA